MVTQTLQDPGWRFNIGVDNSIQEDVIRHGALASKRWKQEAEATGFEVCEATAWYLYVLKQAQIIISVFFHYFVGKGKTSENETQIINLNKYRKYSAVHFVFQKTVICSLCYALLPTFCFFEPASAQNIPRYALKRACAMNTVSRRIVMSNGVEL